MSTLPVFEPAELFVLSLADPAATGKVSGKCVSILPVLDHTEMSCSVLHDFDRSRHWWKVQWEVFCLFSMRQRQWRNTSPASAMSYVVPAPAVYSAPVPVMECIEPAHAVSYAAPAPAVIAAPPVVVYIAPAPAVSYMAPVPAVFNAPEPVVDYIATTPAVSCVTTAVYAASTPVAEYIGQRQLCHTWRHLQTFTLLQRQRWSTTRQRQPYCGTYIRGRVNHERLWFAVVVSFSFASL